MSIKIHKQNGPQYCNMLKTINFIKNIFWLSSPFKQNKVYYIEKMVGNVEH